jgi:hypothetical protein
MVYCVILSVADISDSIKSFVENLNITDSFYYDSVKKTVKNYKLIRVTGFCSYDA